MAKFPIAGEITEALKKIHDELSPYMDKDKMRELDNRLHECFNDIRWHIMDAVYSQVANAIEKAKEKSNDPNEVVE